MPISSAGDITKLLARIRQGDSEAENQVIPLVYDEMRRLAASYMRKERFDHTLQTTALVHEAYLKLVPQRVGWQNRAHFFGVAAQQMRRILIDHARKQKAAKREGYAKKIQLDDSLALALERPADLLGIHEALEHLAISHERQSRVVELRFFGGRKEDEIAQALGVSVETVRRDWRFAKAWLHKELRSEGLA